MIPRPPEAIQSLIDRPSLFLSFPPDVETYFQNQIKSQRERHLLHTSWAGVLLFLLYSVCDYLLVPDMFEQLAFFRFAIALPVLVGACLLYRRMSHTMRERSITLNVLLGGCAGCWLVMQSQAPLAGQEIASFCLFPIFGNIIARIRFGLAVTSSVLFLAFFTCTALTASHIAEAIHITNFILLFSAAVLSLMGNYWHEREERRSFLLAELDGMRKAALQNANRQLEQLSYRDGLTSIHNKRSFDLLVPQIFNDAAKAETSVCVLFIDIDYFKSYNDLYGHLAGDQALQRIAGLLCANFSLTGELVARTGGEEFIGIASGLSLEQGIEFAETIRRGIEQLAIEHEGSEIASVMTASIGIAAIYPHESTQSMEILNAADAALYGAKQSGRNQVRAYVDLLEEITT